MTTEILPGWDPTQPAGERLPPQMREEIARIAPASLRPGDVTEQKIADENVTRPKIANKAIDGTKIDDQAVGREQLSNGAVNGDKLAPEAVTGSKVGAGVMTVVDSNEVEIKLKAKVVTNSQYAQLSADPNVLYLISDG